MAYQEIVAQVPYESSAGDTTTAYTFVKGMIESSSNNAKDFTDQLDQIISDMSESGEFAVNFSLNRELPELVLNALPEAPDIDVRLNTAWPFTNIGSPPISGVNVDTSYQKPVKPASIDSSFDFVQKVYTSDFYQLLSEALLKDLVEGGTGFTELAYQSILDRERLIRARINDRRRVAVDRILGAGSMMPCGFTAEAKLSLEADIAREDAIALQNIVAKDFEITDANTARTKEALQRYDIALRTDFQTSEKMRFEIARGVKELVLAIYAEEMRGYIAEWDGVKAQLEGAKIQADILIEKNKNMVEVWLGKAKLIDSRIAAITSENKSRTDAATAEANIYNVQMQGAVAERNSLIAEVRAGIDLYQADLQKIIAENELNMKSHTSAEELKAEKLVSTAQVLAQAIASAFGQAHVAASYSGSRSSSHRQSHSNSLGENHSFNTDLSTV